MDTNLSDIIIRVKSEFDMQSSDPSTSLDSIKIDLIVVGNSNTGKTSLIKRYAKGEGFYFLI